MNTPITSPMPIIPTPPAQTSPPTDLLVVTPWYPNTENRYAGSFVRESVRCLAPWYPRITIIHVENRPPGDTRAPFWTQTKEGRVLWIGVPMDPMTSRGDMILAQREALRTNALDLLQTAPAIHCHVGAPTGAALIPLIRDETKLVLTEHATYLSKVFRDPKARELYRQACLRADAVTAVSSTTARLIRDTYPEDRLAVTVVPNPVLFANLPVKHSLNPSLSRWLYVGNLSAHKGVRRLLRAFAAWVEHTGDADARLTLVGTGPLLTELQTLTQQLEITERVRFAGAVEPDKIGDVYLAHDVLVHLSHIETFGLTCVEAAACGLPVVVTECGGPSDTMSVHAALGMARYLPVSDEHDVRVVLNMLTGLQRSQDPDNIAPSRRHLELSYSPWAIGASLHALLSGDPLPAPLVHPGMRALAVALTEKQAGIAEQALEDLASFGGGGVYLAGRPPLRELPPSIRVVDISRIERRHPLVRLERAALEKAPNSLLGWSERATEAATAPDVADRMMNRFGRARNLHRRVVRRVQNGPYDYVWRNVGPWYVARRLVDSGTLDALDLDSFDFFIAPDAFATPIAYRAVQLNPNLDVRQRWSRVTIAGLYAERVLLPATHKPVEESESKLDEELEIPQPGPPIP